MGIDKKIWFKDEMFDSLISKELDLNTSDVNFFQNRTLLIVLYSFKISHLAELISIHQKPKFLSNTLALFDNFILKSNETFYPHQKKCSSHKLFKYIFGQISKMQSLFASNKQKRKDDS